MSGVAASASASRFSSFLNHPAGASQKAKYLSSIRTTDKVPPTGPKTVFFWAPMMKWCLVAAGVKDLTRPADKLSVSQNVGASFLTVMVWYIR